MLISYQQSKSHPQKAAELELGWITLGFPLNIRAKGLNTNGEGDNDDVEAQKQVKMEMK